MKFRRIDEDTVRCIISKEDMQEYGIVLEDFFKNKGKIHNFLHEIVERAEQEIGYEPKEGLLSMQIMPISQNSISITFSEHEPEDYEEMMNSIKSSFEELQENAGELMEDEEFDETDIYENYDEDDVVRFGSKYENEDKDVKEVKKNVVGIEKAETIAINMDSIERLAEFCRVLGIEATVKSELYELKSKDIYCLIIEKGRLPITVMRHMITLAVEYEAGITDDVKIIAHIREHGEKIIDKGAYRILKKYI